MLSALTRTVPADETEQPGLGVRAGGYLDPEAELAGGADNLLHLWTAPKGMRSHAESDVSRSQDSDTGGAGGPAVSHA